MVSIISMLVNPMTAVKSSKLVIPTLMVGIIAMSRTCLAMKGELGESGDWLSDYDIPTDIDQRSSARTIRSKGPNCSVPAYTAQDDYESDGEYSRSSPSDTDMGGPSAQPAKRARTRSPTPSDEAGNLTEDERRLRRKRKAVYDESSNPPSKRRKTRRGGWRSWIPGCCSRQQDSSEERKKALDTEMLEEKYYNLMGKADKIAKSKFKALYEKYEKIEIKDFKHEECNKEMEKVKKLKTALKRIECEMMIEKDEREERKFFIDKVLREAEVDADARDEFAAFDKNQTKTNGKIDWDDVPFWDQVKDYGKGLLSCKTLPQKLSGLMLSIGLAAELGYLSAFITPEQAHALMGAAAMTRLLIGGGVTGATPAKKPVGPAAKPGKRRLLTRLALSKMN